MVSFPSSSPPASRLVMVTTVSPSGMATRKSAIWIRASGGSVARRETNETPQPTTNEARTHSSRGHLDLILWNVYKTERGLNPDGWHAKIHGLCSEVVMLV